MSIPSPLATTASRLDTLDFTAVDLETANGQRGSVCGAGIVQVRSGRITRVEQTLVRPPRGLDYFSPRNIAVHGITFKAVQYAPTWPEVWATLSEVAGDDVIVAHNAAVDVSVITGANTACDIDAPWPLELCTVRLAQLLLSNHRRRHRDANAPGTSQERPLHTRLPSTRTDSPWPSGTSDALGTPPRWYPT